MNLPDGLKHAVKMGADEVFLEWLDLSKDDPEGALESLGASYQEDFRPDRFAEDDVIRWVADLAAWDDGIGHPSHAARVRRLEVLICDAGIEFARGMIAQATGEGEIPQRVRPYLPELTPLIDELKRAIAAGTFNDSSFDLDAAIWG
jgi:hypothetical protein